MGNSMAQTNLKDVGKCSENAELPSFGMYFSRFTYFSLFSFYPTKVIMQCSWCMAVFLLFIFFHIQLSFFSHGIVDQKKYTISPPMFICVTKTWGVLSAVEVQVLGIVVKVCKNTRKVSFCFFLASA